MRKYRCASVEDQLDWLSAAGSSDADCWYEENRRAVLGGTWLLFRCNYLYLRDLRKSYVNGAATIVLITARELRFRRQRAARRERRSL
jgi:hypothetical protein